jgi:hypothetical protein
VIQLLTNPLFLIFAPATLVPVTAIIASFWQKAHRDSIEASLKHDMLERGMSADDIVKVLAAGGSKKDFRRRFRCGEDGRVETDARVAAR